MDITLNNMQAASNLICFTDIPNILKISDNNGGSYATITITFVQKPEVNADGEYYITLIGDTITNVMNPQNAINMNFHISQTNTSTAASIARAMRSCPTISAYFTIEHELNSVTLKAKQIGQIFSIVGSSYSTNIPSANMTMEGSDGTATSSLFNSRVFVDIYSNDKYVTTLEKNFHNGETAFDLSPVLATFAEEGNAVPFSMKVYSIKDGEYSLLGNIDTNYISIGYMVNQGNKYLINDYMNIAQNFSRGSNKGNDIENRTTLYTYFNEIPISFYRSNSGGFTIGMKYLDSAFNTLHETTTTIRTPSEKQLIDYIAKFDHSGNAWFQQAFYVDLTIGVTTIRYNVIRPLAATEGSQRVCWRNSYGGISFFDFTGPRSETRSLDTETYQKNIYDYYNSERNTLEKIYNNDVTYSVTLKSHLIEKDGIYIFNDLIQSPIVWTEVNGEKYEIILENVSVDETDSNNNVYEATIKYRYSMEPSLL